MTGPYTALMSMSKSITPHLQVGVAREDVTPKLGVLLMGFPDPHRRAASVRDGLNVTALVFERDGQRAALLSLDVISLDENDVRLIRTGIQAQTGIPADHIIVAATQTHSAPCSLQVWGWADKDQAYIDLVVERSIRAASTAYAGLQPAHMGIGVTHSEVGVNRRAIQADHSIGLGVNPWGPYDPVMTVLRFEGQAGPLATVIHYGAHPTVLHDRQISRDWPGIMVDRVERLTGAPALFVNGAVGDIAPRSNYLSAVGDGEVALQEVGTRAATDAMKAYRSIHDWRNAELAVLAETTVLPYRPFPSQEAAQQELALAEPNKASPGAGMMNYKYWQAVIAEHTGTPQTGKTFGQILIQLGPVVFVPIPGEPFAEIVLRLREHSPFEHTLPLSTTNGNIGYFPTRESLHRGGYEVWVAKAFGAYISAENIDDVLVEENLKLLNKLAAR